MNNNIRSNFDVLQAYEAQLWRLGALAERYFAEDPNTSLLKLRQFSELLAQSLAARTGLYTHPFQGVCFLAVRSTLAVDELFSYVSGINVAFRFVFIGTALGGSHTAG